MSKKNNRRIFWTLDAETDPFLVGREPEPFIWGAYCGENELGLEEYYEFYTIDEVVEFFESKAVVVYAHNGGKYDYQIRHKPGNHRYFCLRDAINSDEPIMVINGRLAKFRIGKAEFRDSLNILPNTRLEDFGGKIKIDYSKMERDKRSDPNVFSEIRTYLRQDCRLLWEVVSRYRRDYGCGLTQAGSSMKYWSKMYHVEPPRQTKAQHDRYRPYYYGGRVQCFESGVLRTAFSVADINSAYPFAMLRDHAFCTEGRRQTHLPPEPKLSQCLITLDATSRGALPWRDPEDGELYFP
ncbi:MAG TPA: DNA polymerase, partial [Pyrinomonadaceae bacterium]|nr:DNA polymerase [Pyrinomonadaceae bacterium]